MDSIRIGLAGLGTVGCGVLDLFARNGALLQERCGRAITVTGVCARDRARERGVDLSAYEWFDNPAELARSGAIDIFVELIGGDEGPAREAVEAALSSGKHVVTANKALLAKHGVALARLAEANGVALNFEAAVAGAIPIVKTMRESAAGNRISRIYGILNGTCNYILTRMRDDGHSFDTVLADAQAAGYAEEDPTFDVDGHDTAHKLAILTSMAFGTEISFENIYMEGIRSISPDDIEAADELGYKIKLLGVALRTETGIEQRVHPAMVPSESAIAQVDGVLNCVAVECDFAGDIMLVGPGAGAKPTASSVVSDIADIARGNIPPVLAHPAASLKPNIRAGMRAHEGGYYIRLSVHDRPGAFASIAQRMATEKISLQSIVQKKRHGKPSAAKKDQAPEKPARVIIITHETTEAAIRQALDAIEADGHVDNKPQMIRIERL
jgi:homoserine dehydrogenase